MMNKVVKKELHRLIDLCTEINEKTKHGLTFTIFATGKPSFNVTVWEHGIIEAIYQKTLTGSGLISLPNINKCRKELLKYKEW